MKAPWNLLIALALNCCFSSCYSQKESTLVIKTSSDLQVGAERMEEYLPLIQGKTIAVVANHTSMIKQTHLVDSLVSLRVKIKCVFAPEHGFRGNFSYGQHIVSEVDEGTGLFIVSLYGKNMKPTQQALKDVDVVLFDIQDVGARFFTYISTLQKVMEACAEQSKTLIVLDRPNPNGFYIDGPVLEKSHTSFVGMNQVPVVYGLTIGEYAQMLNGERWLANQVQCQLSVIKIKNYDHGDLYQLPIRPSPNLPDMTSVYLYPSLCFFEGTRVSIGRGTDKPFKMIGYPGFRDGDVQFTPKSLPGIADHPVYEDTLCNGLDVEEFGKLYALNFRKIYLFWLKEMHDTYPDKTKFFNTFFEKLAGNDQLRKQISEGKSEADIRKSWQNDLNKYKIIRKKYLLYNDF